MSQETITGPSGRNADPLGAPSCAELAMYEEARTFCAQGTGEDFDAFICRFASDFIIDQDLRDACFTGAFKSGNVEIAQHFVDCARIMHSGGQLYACDVSQDAYEMLVRGLSCHGKPSVLISPHVVLNAVYHIFENININTFGEPLSFALHGLVQNPNFSADLCLLRAVHGGIKANVEFLIESPRVSRLLTAKGIAFAISRAREIFRPDIARVCMRVP